jgi:HipA-like protein
MATLPVYFEQRRVGTIEVYKGGPTFTYDPNWIQLRGAFPTSVTMPLGPHCSRHLSTMGSKPAARERAAANARATSRDGAE